MLPRLAALAAAVAGASAGRRGDAVVRLPFGDVRGREFSDHREFLSIPYATVKKRFAAPQPWTEPYPEAGLNATSLGRYCWQRGCDHPPPGYLGCSEDCLQLNVYAPRGAGRAPVMLWIHGGSLEAGSGMDASFNGSRLVARHGVAVVTINYRLNVFGFAAVPQADGTTLANNGYRDQREAMRWVRQNIGAFGGDAKRLTIFGQSAGGQSVLTHVLSPGSAGLFDAGISESGDTTWVQSSLADKRRFFENLGAAVGCTGSAAALVACMEVVNATKLVDAYVGMDPPPTPAVVDGDIYPAPPVELARQGRFNRVPLIIGSNANEANEFILSPKSPTRPASVQDAVCAFNRTFGPAKLGAVLDVYTPTQGVDNRMVISDLFSDLLYHCVDRELARGLTQNGSAPWVYKFKRAPRCSTDPGTPGAYHSSEVPFAWDTVAETADAAGCAASDGEIALGRRMAGLWASFATDLEADPAWKPYSLPAEPSLSIDLGTVGRLDHEEGYHRAQCDLIDRLVPTDGDVPVDMAMAMEGSLRACQAARYAAVGTSVRGV